MVKFNDGRTARTAWSPLIPEVTSQLSELKRSQGLSRSLSDHQADLRIGQPVVAVGSPLGLDDTVTPGVVSGLSRPVCTGADAESLLAVYDAIQTDAALNPGNSGGALVDMNGDLIGVNSAAAAPPGLLVETGNRESGSIGGGFAIPGDYAKRISSELIATGTARTLGWEAEVRAQMDMPGARIIGVTSGGHAASAGLSDGALVTNFDERLIENASALAAAVQSKAPGAQVTLGFLDASGERRTVQVKPGHRSGPASIADFGGQRYWHLSWIR
jgi:putative serine protease PepD